MSSQSDYERATVETHQPGRLRRAWDTLQDTITQPVQTVTRSATLKSTGGNVEDIDAPDDIDEYVDLYYQIGFIRKNLSEFVADVLEPGIRVESDDDATQDYFMGGDNAPEGAPEGGFLSECYVIDEKRQPIRRGAKLNVLDKWRRGTVLIEKLYDDPENPDSIITGFKHIRPETVSARTYENTNILIAPDDTDNADMTTPRGEAAAWVQFDENSILSRVRDRDFSSRESVPLSQNDVLKQTLDQDIGGSDPEDGVFGESIISSIADPAAEYRDISRNEAKAIQGKAWGIWTLQANDYVIEAEGQNILVEWDDDDIDSLTNESKEIEPGELISTDAKVDLERHDGDVPDLDNPMRRRIREIIDPLPAPYYKHSFADEINQFVTEDQQEDYQDLIRGQRQDEAEFWEEAFRDVAERHDALEPEGLTVSIEPEEDDSPVMSLDAETIDKISTFATAMKDLYGPGGAPSFVEEAVINQLILQLPEDANMDAEEMDDLSLDDLEQFAQAD